MSKFIRYFVLFSILSVFAAGCAGVTQDDLRSGQNPPEAGPASSSNSLTEGRDALREGKYDVALTSFGAALRNDPSNGYLQFLYGFTYHNKARQGDAGAWELARVGYGTALRFAPTHYWSALYLGILEFERRNYISAQENFAQAVLNNPDRIEGFIGLAHASYFAGDLLLADAATRHALEMLPDEKALLQIGVLIATALDHPDDAMHRLMRYRRVSGAEETKILENRMGLLKRTLIIDNPSLKVISQTDASQLSELPPVAMSDISQPESVQETDAASGSTEQSLSIMQNPEGPNQVMVDLTIIMDSHTKTTATGINLLDGLQLQYGYSNEYNRVNTSDIPDLTTRTITSSIAIPQITYNLNLFNASGQVYQVLARPSLTAYYQRESQFFTGRTINVQTSGVNVATIEPIDVGISLRVTPERITGEGVTFRVSAARSFLSENVAGTFSESITTFRQEVSATADVRFGQTLVLSGLSENVRDYRNSKVPEIGDIPIINTVFNRRTELQREDSVLILVTPVQPFTIDQSNQDLKRTQTTQRLVSLWTRLVDPKSDLSHIAEKLRDIKLFKRAEPDDGNLRTLWDPGVMEDALNSALSHFL